jgi:hypothetical protein
VQFLSVRNLQAENAIHAKQQWREVSNDINGSVLQRKMYDMKK